MLKGNRFLQTRPSSSSDRVTFAFGESDGRTLLYLFDRSSFASREKKSRSTCLTATTTRRSEIQWSDFCAAVVVALWWITACPASAPVHAGKRFSLLQLQNSGWFDPWCFALLFCWWRLLLLRSFRSLTECFYVVWVAFRRPRATRQPGNRSKCRSEEAMCRLEAVIRKLMTLFFFKGGSLVHCGQTILSDFRTQLLTSVPESTARSSSQAI